MAANQPVCPLAAPCARGPLSLKNPFSIAMSVYKRGDKASDPGDDKKKDKNPVDEMAKGAPA